jgi:hypothetical protein
VVFDDAVEHDVDVAGAVTVRMRVRLGNPAVRCPAGVAEPGGRGRRGHGHGALRRYGPIGVEPDGGAQVGEVADGAHRRDLTVGEQRDTRGVIAAVLELLQTGDEEIPTWALAHVSDDSAHK